MEFLTPKLEKNIGFLPIYSNYSFLFGGLNLLTQGSAVAPFIYTWF